MSWRDFRAALICVVGAGLLLGAFAGCDHERDTDDSETHFLTYCGTRGECPGGLECLCGVCTKTCAAAADCPSVPGAVCRAECSESPKSVCDVECERDAECRTLGPSFGCRASLCRESARGNDAGAGGANGDAGANGGASSPDAAASGGRQADAGSGGQVSTTAPREAGVRPACNADPDPTPTLPALSELDPDVVARAAAVVAACWPNDGVTETVEYVWPTAYTAPISYQRTAAQIACLADARCGCGATEHCLSLDHQFNLTATCTPSCSGSVYTTCTGVMRYTIDCGKVGLTCDPALGCVLPEADPCDFATFEETCTPEGRGSSCVNSRVWHGPVCASLGLACENGECVGTGAACNIGGPGPSRGGVSGMSCSVDGSTLNACVGGRQALLDCSLQGPGFRCQEAEGIAFCGLASECVPDLGYLQRVALKESCDGDTLVFCNKGRIERIDCLSLGFVGCDLDSDFLRYGCVDAQSCGNGIVDPGEQCEDGNHDRFDGCIVCRWSCTEDRHCDAMTEDDECRAFVCQSDHTCAPGAPKSDGTSCSLTTDTATLHGSCTAGVCTPPTTCGAIQCKDTDGNACNGKPACVDPPDSSGSCTGAIAPLAPGAWCNSLPSSVCDVNGACVPGRCGNGVVDADLGEDCDPPGGICNSECQHSF